MKTVKEVPGLLGGSHDVVGLASGGGVIVAAGVSLLFWAALVLLVL